MNHVNTFSLNIMTSTTKPNNHDWHSITGTVSAFFYGETNEIHIKATEVVDCDITRLRRTADGDYIIRGLFRTLSKHGIFDIGAPVKVLVRPFWSHVSINGGKPVVWIRPE